MPDGVRAVLLDIEGTTTPLAFVEEVLFPYARERLEEAVARAGEDREVAAAIGRLRAEHEAERRQGGADAGAATASGCGSTPPAACSPKSSSSATPGTAT
jgi:enolase-phosphatase E1